MKFLHGGQVVRLAIDQIEVEARLRDVREAFVENLMLMAEDTGITTPIHVRRVGGRHLLIDGAHRLEAARRMGLPDIAALVVECRAEEARAMEASNNLGAARMTPLQTAVFVASWKRDYYAMHPERRPGAFKGNRHTGKLVGDNLSLTRSIADAFGVDERTVQRALAVGERLTPDEVSQLAAAPRRVTMEDLKALARIAEPEERAQVVLRLAGGNARSVASARRTLREEQGVKPPPKSREDQQLLALLSAWSAAGKTARRRFVEDVFATLSPLVDEEAARRGAGAEDGPASEGDA